MTLSHQRWSAVRVLHRAAFASRSGAELFATEEA
jgi:hypothetical protein